MRLRRRFKHQLTPHNRLSAWSKKVEADAQKLPPGPERDALIKKAQQADIAHHLDDWAKSPGLQLRLSISIPPVARHDLNFRCA